MIPLSAEAAPSQVRLYWPAEPKASKYRLRRASPPGAPLETLGPAVQATTYTDATVSPGTSYDYVVVALDRRGHKLDSSPRLLVTTPTPIGYVPPVPGYGAGVTGGGSAIPSRVTSVAEFIEACHDTGPRVIYSDRQWLLGAGQQFKVNGDITLIDVAWGMVGPVFVGDNIRLHGCRGLPNDLGNSDTDGLTVNGQSSAGPVQGFASSHGWYCGGPDMGGGAILGEVFDLTLYRDVYGPGLRTNKVDVASGTTDHNRILNYTTFGEHAAGPWGKRQTTMECLVWGGEERNPDIKYVEQHEFLRSLIYNNRENPNGNPRGTIFAYNRVRPGPESASAGPRRVFETQVKPDETVFPASVYLEGNVADGFPYAERVDPAALLQEPAWEPSVSLAGMVAPGVEELLAIVGPTTGRNAQELRLLEYVRSRTSEGYYTGPGTGTPNLEWPANP